MKNDHEPEGASMLSNYFLPDPEILNVMLKKLPVIICRVDSKGNFTQILGKGLHRIGLKDNELTGKNIFDVYPQISVSVKQVLEGKSVSFISNINYKNSVNYFENYFFPEENGSLGFIFDITEKKIAEEKIKKSESLLLEAQELAKMGSWEWDINSNQMSWSPEMFRILDKMPTNTPETFESYMECVHEDDIEHVRNVMQKVFSNHRMFSFEHTVRTPANNIKNIWCIGKPVINDNGMVRITGFCQDISLRKKAEADIVVKNKELKKAKKALQEANSNLEEKVKARTDELSIKNNELSKINSDLDNFVYTASHDLKAPISNLEGLLLSLDTLLPEKDQDVKDTFSMLFSSIVRLKGTITDLSEITKVQKNIENENEKVHYAELCKEIEETLKDSIAENNAVIHTDFSECPSIEFSKKNLRSILLNLISNSIKYRNPDKAPEITLVSRMLPVKGTHLLEVRDNGLGIKKSQQDKIFSMFKRLHDHVEGSGIGLYLVKRIIQNNGGTIEVESEPGKGTVFKIYFKPEF